MSEKSEHSPDDTEAKTKALEKDLSKSEAKLMMDQIDGTLLEDEEMPTYISVSSISRRDDSDVVNAKQQESVCMEEERSPGSYPSDDQAASSVCVLSSGEETDQPPYNDEDDEDEYGDSDDMENLELDNELDSEHQNNMRHLLDEEDDDDDDEDEEDDEEGTRPMHNDDDEDIDGNYEMEYFDRVSDDFILNKRTKNHYKEKSLSLQDLSVCKNNIYSQCNKRKYPNILRQNYLNIPQNAVMCSVTRRKQPTPSKYQHVESKVKLYIKDIKEQNRRSTEKHMEDQEATNHSKSNVDYKNNETEEIKPVTNNKMIKNYAEKTIKELEIAEACDRNKKTYVPQIAINGQDNKNGLGFMGEEQSHSQDKIQINTFFKSTQDEKDMVKSDDKLERQNGATKATSEKDVRKFGDMMQSPFIQNGHQQVLFNVHSLSYEDYMRCNSISSQKADIDENADIIEGEEIQSETYNDDVKAMDVSDIDNNDTTCHLRIEDIKSIRTMTDEVKNNEQISFVKMNEEFSTTVPQTLEVIALKDQLNQKTIQYNNLHDTYQKQLAENLRMKQELDELRKSLAKYEKQNAPEQKVASIQTDFIIDTAAKQSNQVKCIDNIKQANNKISSSSVALTLSSIDQWTDSNLSISMKPPEVAKASHSDDSMILTDGTPRKPTRSLSRAFITSSRILQTLSNITQGKMKSDSPLVQNPKKRLNENAMMEQQSDDNRYPSRPSSSKRRKISDILSPTSFLQTFKMASPASELQSKLNEMPNTESQMNYSNESMGKKSESQENSSNINTSQLENTVSIENKAEIIEDVEDNVKCFVYRENEDNKDRSFLILAEEPAKDKVVNEKGRIRECGPYLLGNVEVRMSEINGTINIWGKEINEEFVLDNENEVGRSGKVKDNKRCHCCQKAPYIRFNGSNIVCSTSKKSKAPAKLQLIPNTSNFSCSHSASFNTTKPSCSAEKGHSANPCSPNVCVSSCEDCDSSKHRKEWLRYKRTHPQEKLRSCCNQNVDTLGHKCSCLLHRENQKYEDNVHCSKERLNTKENQSSFSRNLLEPNKHLHENIANLATEDNELTCGYHTIHHQSRHDPEENCQESHKCNIFRNTCTCEPLTINTSRESSAQCNHNSPSIHEDEPLISQQSSEIPETRRRRLTGRKVRSLLDLLRSCADCYNSDTSNNTSNKSCSHKKETSHSTDYPPQIKMSPCASAEPSYSNSGQPTGRCCHAYAQRIESQLEEFRVEMERVRSRSDAILDMLNMLHSVDMN